jgi:acetyl-CoA carboxylase biotin carboxylase subunit
MPAQPLKRVLIANRGEIAVRVIRACRALGLETVAAVSQADRESLPARLATRSVCIGPSPARESYLRPELLITAAKGTGCDAVHPGYGFLSERAAFARLCAQAGVTFIGPSPEAIEAMGDKLAAVELAAAVGVPRVPGSGRIAALSDAHAFSVRHGFPLLIKASAGGGGRGMRIVKRQADLARALDLAATEAQGVFGDPSLYLEKFIEHARHVEIQVLGDSHGNLVHLGERDCSTQRRHQKLIEEAASPAVDAGLREALAEAAIRLARQVNYQGAGTVEFIVDDDTRRWYFLEMNTRIQVEHPVTEMVAGRDIVVEQLRVAAGAALSFTQSDVKRVGHAIECRINAEDPARCFLPSPGTLRVWKPPQLAGVRIDTHCYAGYVVPPFYDSLLAKVIVHAETRALAIDNMLTALGAFEVAGVPTTIPFHRDVLRHDDFRFARVTTRWVEEKFLAAAAAGPLLGRCRATSERGHEFIGPGRSGGSGCYRDRRRRDG